MFAIPVGLEAKTRDFPLATFAIFALTCVLALPNLSRPAQLQKQLLSSDVVKARVQAQQELALAACPQKFQPADCALLKSVLHPTQREEFVALVYRVRRQLADKDRKMAAPLVQYLFNQEWEKAPSETRALAEFQKFMEAKRQETTLKTELDNRFQLMSRNTFSPLTLFLAQVFHHGWMHLIANMLFLLLFAIPLEQRIGALPLILLYAVGGSAGLTFQLMIASDPSQPLLGASAGVFAVAAGFMIAFWSFSMRVWISFLFIVNQVVYIRTWLFFPLLLLMQEVTGTLETNAGGVAHAAHLAGFVVGALIAGLIVRLKPLSPGIAFPFEQELLHQAQNANDPDKKLGFLAQILSFHPSCAPALESVTIILESWKKNWSAINHPKRHFLQENFDNMLSLSSSSGRLIAIMSQLDWPFSDLVQSRNVPQLLSEVLRVRETEPQVALILLNITLQIESKAESVQSRSAKLARSKNLNQMRQLKSDLDRRLAHAS